MKIRFSFTLMILTFGALILAVDIAARSDKWGLPEGARSRIGKGTISRASNVIEYSPDGTQIALASSIGIWIYDARTYQERALFGAHSGVVLSIAYSPNGNMLVSGGEDGAVRFWDTTSGRLLRTINSGVESEIAALGFSSDGDTIAHSTGLDIHLRSAATGELLKTLMGPRRKEHYEITCLAFSPDGSTIVSGDSSGFDGNLYLWSVATGKLLREIDVEELRAVNDVAFSPDGSTIATTASSGFGGGKILLISASSDKLLTQFEESEAARPTFSPDGSTIAVRPAGGLAGQSMECEIALMSASTGKVLKLLRGSRKYDGIEITIKVEEGVTSTRFEHTSMAYPGFMTDIAFSPDGSTIAAAGNGSFFVWSATTGELLKEITGYTDESEKAFAFSPDGTKLAFVKNGTVEFWSVATGKLLEKCIGVPNDTERIAFSPDGKKIVAVEGQPHGGRFRLLDIDKSSALMKMQPTATGDFTDLTEKKPLVFDKERNSLYYRLQDVCIIDRNSAEVYDFAFVPGGNKIVTATDPYDVAHHETQVQTWSVATGELISTTISISNRGSGQALFSPDGSRVLVVGTISGQDNWHLFSVATGALLKKPNLSVKVGVFSPDGSTIAGRADVLGKDGKPVWGKHVLHLLSVETSELLKKINLNSMFPPVFSPDGSTIAGIVDVGEEYVLHLFSVATGSLLKKINLNSVRAPVFSPDGRTIATQGDDGTILLWDTH